MTFLMNILKPCSAEYSVIIILNLIVANKISIKIKVNITLTNFRQVSQSVPSDQLVPVDFGVPCFTSLFSCLVVTHATFCSVSRVSLHSLSTEIFLSLVCLSLSNDSFTTTHVSPAVIYEPFGSRNLFLILQEHL